LEQQQKKDDALDDVQIEYVVQPVDMSALKNMDGMSNLDENTLQQFSDIFKHFQTGKPEEDDEVCQLLHLLIRSMALIINVFHQEFPVQDNTVEQDKEENSDDEEKDDQPLSKKKMKKIQRLTVAELKQLVKKPETVEVL